MSQQHPPTPPRRSFLKKTLALIPLAAAGTTGVLTLAAPKASAAGVTSHYVPIYFNNDEWRFLLAACDRLIPSDNHGPGAIEEAVPVFIDKQMETPYGHGGLWYMHPPFIPSPLELGYQSKLTPRDTYRICIRELNTHCHQQYQKVFADLEHSQQEQILTALEKGELDCDALPGKAFFAQLLQNTKEGYLADPLHGGNQSMASWKLIGFPGARADFTDWVNHPNQAYPLGPVSISSKRNT
ncbi:gluconate 2-dehydrogenase subunit 3 family protein [Serratia sp. UGAL515B_01]|uniref:gluconate 2-dehydrogenase subunit 3 family protein n=1 Tax=Serratia sp. UGAL515B_01 TaxID=2986763 RepID=UPI002953EAC1|nr:gluconate 2-dehydrogenase subunit 3 family protein [Serratia sp. UGAL515B_01]WON78494.1 gluconate 2-dehydrogenase subunit 3 family protein [Serratia sp. UGAL515B_01]